jgi:hypothetical protein
MALNLRPDSAATTVSGETFVAIARRYWWVSTLILLLVALVAGARYLTAPQRYLASQDLSIALVPVQTLSNPGDAALAMSGAQMVAHAMTSPDLMASSAFADAVLARIPADIARHEQITKVGVQKALSAIELEARARIQAAWSSEAGARAIVTAAALALQANPPIPANALTPGDSVSTQVAPPGVLVKLDPQQQANTINALVQLLLVGFGIALLLPWIFAGLTRARAESSPAAL